jgi:hypothetical protein
MKIIPLFLLLSFLSTVLIPSCDSPGQPVQANTAPVETTVEVATLALSNLSIVPAESSISCDILNIDTDEEIIISVIATNTDINQLSQDIVLYVDLIEVESTSVTLAGGESERVEFSLLWGKKEEGIYTANIGGLQAIFGVG